MLCLGGGVSRQLRGFILCEAQPVMNVERFHPEGLVWHRESIQIHTRDNDQSFDKLVKSVILILVSLSKHSILDSWLHCHSKVANQLLCSWSPGLCRRQNRQPCTPSAQSSSWLTSNEYFSQGGDVNIKCLRCLWPDPDTILKIICQHLSHLLCSQLASQ